MWFRWWHSTSRLIASSLFLSNLWLRDSNLYQAVVASDGVMYTFEQTVDLVAGDGHVSFVDYLNDNHVSPIGHTFRKHDGDSGYFCPDVVGNYLSLTKPTMGNILEYVVTYSDGTSVTRNRVVTLASSLTFGHDGISDSDFSNKIVTSIVGRDGVGGNTVFIINASSDIPGDVSQFQSSSGHTVDVVQSTAPITAPLVYGGAAHFDGVDDTAVVNPLPTTYTEIWVDDSSNTHIRDSSGGVFSDGSPSSVAAPAIRTSGGYSGKLHFYSYVDFVMTATEREAFSQALQAASELGDHLFLLNIDGGIMLSLDDRFTLEVSSA